MRLYIIDGNRVKEAELFAYSINGEEVTLSLIEQLMPDDYKENGECDCFYKLTDEEKEYHSITADYAITKAVFNTLVDFIDTSWQSTINKLADMLKKGYISDIDTVIDDSNRSLVIM